ncbi:SusC/RagA family TonB-linked outer membrane protein [Mucilaginibacter kameinonensis]|uniref:SusC/RagA family TonB-linked outer membrane protein n=1 Tax=Mucilaginibacter kameinonensis TaxID=452286 RepID=UPI001FC90FD9|nr:SusC/RagA family TonB-linked outer membrane protein [Mucilaginibacter kameinonensis]
MRIKLSAIVLVIAMVHASASSLAQRVTLNVKNAPIEDVLNDIKKQTGYVFFYDHNDLKDKKVTVQIKVATIKDALNACFQNNDLTYTIENKTIVIRKTSVSPTGKNPSANHIPTSFSGTITDSLNNPVVGANIMLKGTGFGTQTDGKGDFHFNDIPQGEYTLVITHVGYQREEYPIDCEGKTFTMRLFLHQGLSQLDQVQVIAYGSATKRFSVGSVATVSSIDIERQPVTNPLLALQGQVAGLNVTATSGVPGSQVLVQIRGQNTLTLSANGARPYDQPLFIIDGVPFASQNNNVSQFSSLATAQSFQGGISQSGGFSPFNNIDPSDIESISILKDADATSIYGTQGSNGVILITTKKGKVGPTAFDLNVKTGFNSYARPVQLLNTQQYLQLRKDAYASDGITPSNDPNDYDGYAPDLTIFDQNKFTDWKKVILGRNTNMTDVHGSLSGGSPSNTFIISGGYGRSDYNYPGNFADQRFTIHSNLHHISDDKRFTIDLTNDYGYDQNNSAGYGGAQDILLAPNLPDLLGPNGRLLWNYKGVDLSSYQFYSSLQQTTNLQNYNYNANLSISYKILSGLNFSVNLGYNRNNTTEHQVNPASAQNPAYAYATAKFGDNTFQTLNIEPQLNYNKTVGKHNFSALVGATYKKNTNTATQQEGDGYANDHLLGSINGAPTIYNNDTYNIYRYNAGFARIKDIYNNEFIIELTGRRDGSSNFGPGLQFGNFGSIGAGWIFTEENFLKNKFPFLSYGKLSGNYGTSGSDGVAAYQFQTLYRSLTGYPAFQGIQPSVPLNLYNPDYSWALKKSLNIALDFGMFNNRLLLNATYYRNREGNQLVDYPLPIQSGMSSVLENLDAVIQNKGYEFSLSSTNIQSKNFTWSTNLNFSFNRNKLLSFPNLESSSYAYTYAVGQPTSIIYGYRYKDVNPQTGLFEFYTKDGGVTSNPTSGQASTGGDQVPIANREVNYSGGIGNNFRYKQFNLFIFCQFSSQDAPTYLATLYGYPPGTMLMNEPQAILNNYWKAPGDIKQLQRLSSSYNSAYVTSAQDFAQSSGVHANDTYLRIKNISLSYTLPDALLKKVHIKGGSIYANAQNVLTFTNYKVGDPEQFSSYASYPIQRVLAFGLNLKF